MKIKEVELNTLKLPDYMKREHTVDQIGRFIKSLEQHGQYQPIVVAEQEILCGTLAYLAMQRLGWKTCKVNDLGNISIERRREIRYLDNQIFDIEDWEGEAFKKFLMEADEDELNRCAFRIDEAELFINLDPEEQLPKPERIPLKTMWSCENCGWSGTLE